ncbi:CD276 antigen-like isoform X1 [Cetorhinus maximus]
MDPERRRTLRGTRLVPGLFECGLLLCWGAVPLTTLAVSGIVGESALLSCVDSTVGKHANDEIRVYWQRVGQFVHAFYSGQEHANQNYSNRAKLFTKEFQQGNFSLLLSDLQVSDDAEYTCIIQMKQPTEYNVVLTIPVTLQVAAHYTEPVLTAEPEQRDLDHGELVRVICSSWGGYPEPIVHWTIMNIFNESRTVKNHISCSRKELCNITSTLWIQAKSDFVTLRCSIYNAKLQENKTATLSWNFSNECYREAIVPVNDAHHRWIIPVVLVTLIIVCSLAAYILLKSRFLLSAGNVAAEQNELASFNFAGVEVEAQEKMPHSGQGSVEIQLLTEGLEMKNVKEKD